MSSMFDGGFCLWALLSIKLWPSYPSREERRTQKSIGSSPYILGECELHNLTLSDSGIKQSQYLHGVNWSNTKTPCRTYQIDMPPQRNYLHANAPIKKNRRCRAVPFSFSLQRAKSTVSTFPLFYTLKCCLVLLNLSGFVVIATKSSLARSKLTKKIKKK